MTLKQVEKLLVTHLQESGQIKEGIKNVRNAVYGLYGLIALIIAAIVTVGLERTWR